MGIWSRNHLGHILWVKRLLISILGIISYRRYFSFNKLTVTGKEHLRNLPDNNVLFIANHQTYFADAAAMLHVFNQEIYYQKTGKKSLWYIIHPKLNMYYIAALETMKKGILPRILAYTGSVSIERTWRSGSKDINRKVKISDINNIDMAVQDGWVITFPQGTTQPFSPVRRGTSHIIKSNKPLVIPIVIDGFGKAFDKKGLLIRQKNIDLSMRIKAPLIIDYENDSADDIVLKITDAIEQRPPKK